MYYPVIQDQKGITDHTDQHKKSGLYKYNNRPRHNNVCHWDNPPNDEVARVPMHRNLDHDRDRE